MVSDVGVAVEEARELVRLAAGGDGSVGAPPSGAEVDAESEADAPEHEIELSSELEPEAPDIRPDPPDGMCHVAGGIFQFGEGKEPRYLDDFFVDRCPVTNGAYAAFVAETGHRSPRFWNGSVPPAGKADHPVVGVSLEDAVAFAEWAGVRLPTEEEWEKAARGSDGRMFPWGDRFTAGRSNVAGAGIKDTSAVGRFREGASPCGCLDIAGNVWEWTDSAFRPGGVKRALKGGSWYDFSTYARCEGRFSAAPGYEGNSVGFRCVADPDTPRTVSRRFSVRDEYDEDVLAGCRARDAAAHPREEPKAVEPAEDPPAPGPLLDLIESTVGALSAFDVGKARACVEEVFEEPGDVPEPETPIEPPDPVPEWTYSLPDARWAEWVRPVLRELARLVPWCYRGARDLDRFFRSAPRWASLALIMIIPVSTFGLVWMGGVSSAGSREAERPAPNGNRPSDRDRPPRAAAARGGARDPADGREGLAAAMRKPTPPEAIGVAPKERGDPAEAAPNPPPGMVLVPAGPFKFGRERTPRDLGAFFVDRTEVTNHDYRKFVRADGYPAPSHWPGDDYPPGTGLHPVTNVDIADARAFATWAAKRLPTEEEWEKAARGTEGFRYPWGDRVQPGRGNLFRPTAQFLGTRAVGSFPSGASPYGCLDMAGNVLEWTTTRFRNNFVLKGGSWGLSRDGGASDFRYVHFPPETRTPMVGFRCVKEVSEN